MNILAIDKIKIGDRYGIVTVLQCPFKRIENGRAHRAVLAKCDCGIEFSPRAHHLLAGKTKSCGCVREMKFAKSVAQAMLPPGESLMRSLYYTYKSGAKRRNLAFELTMDEFREITARDCSYCGCKPKTRISRARRNGDFIYNGIDRVDNTIGYTKSNSVTCCKECNEVKSKKGIHEVKDWVRRFVLHQYGVQL